jgi:hypothetical protein
LIRSLLPPIPTKAEAPTTTIPPMSALERMDHSKMALLRHAANVDPRITLPLTLLALSLLPQQPMAMAMATPIRRLQTMLATLVPLLADGLLPRMVNPPLRRSMESSTTIARSAGRTKAGGPETTLKLNTLMATFRR